MATLHKTDTATTMDTVFMQESSSILVPTMDTLSKDDPSCICPWYALPMDSVTVYVEDVHTIVSFFETSKLQQWFQLDTYDPDVF